MNPMVILLAGMAVVVGGILFLRLHAFLSLAAGALVVAMITPASYVQRFTLRDSAATIIRQEGLLLRVHPKSALPPGSALLILRPEGAGYATAALARITEPANSDGVQTAVLETGEASPRLTPDEFAVEPSAAADARKAAQQTIGERVAEGFGRSAREIGVLIAMASILGKTLMESGAAERIVDSCRQAVGEKRVALAFMLSAFGLAGLVLADTTFYMLIPLAQAMGVRNKRDYTLYVLAIVAGATMTHSLVPPAPGPVIIASELHVPLMTMILAGLIIGGIASSAGYCYALWANVRWVIPVRGGLAGAMENRPAELASPLPPLWLALAPIALPVSLIALRAVVETDRWNGNAGAVRVLMTLGEKNVALCLGAAVGLLLVWLRYRKQTDAKATSQAAVAHGLASGGVIVLIISAGGALGLVLRQTDIGATLRDLLPVSKLALIPLAFLVTTAIRTAQGSATVAIITTAGIVAPIAAAGDLGFHPVYLASAIGCGSKPGMWMNDAGFWIIGKASGFTEGETLKTATVLMSLMGVVGLLATLAGAWLLPLAQHTGH